MGRPVRWGYAARPVWEREGPRGKLGTGWNPSLPRGGARPIISLVTHEPPDAAHGTTGAVGLPLDLSGNAEVLGGS